MARKKIEPIEKLGTINKLTVQKSKPLFALWQSELTLAEFKILDTYLGRINSHDEEHRTVKFEKGELEKLLGIKQIKPEVLDDRLNHLMTTVKIPNENSKKGFTRISLFEKAYAEQDEYGTWQVELTCTPSAKQYIFNVEDIGYLRYKLRCVINMKSRYTYILFLYLWENKYKGTWEISLNELKSMLCCDSEETYKEFKRFNDLILKKVHKEIHEVTDIQYDYKTIKKGRNVVAIKFIYKSKETIEENADFTQLTLEQCEAELNRELWESALDDFHFTKEQLDEIRELLVVIPYHVLPQAPACYDDIPLMRFHYMKLKAKEIIRRDTEDGKSPVRSKFAYLRKMMQNDAKQ